MSALGTVAILGAALGFLIWATPVTDEGAKDWTAPMIPGGWMAWTFPVALFFWIIASLLVLFTILAIRFPETPRLGILRIILITRQEGLGCLFVFTPGVIGFGQPILGITGQRILGMTLDE